MADTSMPTRLIVCVDGTWCQPDGSWGSNQGNITNIYRICASIKVGKCLDPKSNITYIQQKKYYNGIGSETDISLISRLEKGANGSGFKEMIRDIYEQCCTLPEHPQNEVWFFGFSRGAYVVRAVAGLLHYFRALTSAGTSDFQKHYKNALEKYRAMQRSSKLEQVGQIHSLLASSTREGPKIQFVGAFDTVKAVNDDFLYDITFNNSIQHLRHALSLNENRKAFKPEYIFPDYRHVPFPRRSMVQAWFVGAHIDMGGSAAKDGLSLYPLQWILGESQSNGLVLEFDGSFGNRAYIENPLDLVFPSGASFEDNQGVWSCMAKNKTTVRMQDIRSIHEVERYVSRYAIHLNLKRSSVLPRGPRKPFTKETGETVLRGYCEYAPQGTILHPSVYLIFDEYSHVFLNSKDLAFRDDIEEVRSVFVPDDIFWRESRVYDLEDPAMNPDVIRILVCGNSGIGKSTLINEVFGTELTTASDRRRGVHNIRSPVTSENRPTLLIHDSGGLESGTSDELQQLKEFIGEMSQKTEIKDRLHVIWFCMEVNSTRTQQKGPVAIFSALAENSEIPIVIVGTKKDEFLDMHFGKARRQIKDLKKLEVYCEEELRQRMLLIEKELQEIKDARFDAMVAVSKDDKESIEVLTEETANCFSHEKVRMLYVAAQVTRIDLKVDLAISQIMKVYKNTLASSSTVGMLPSASTTNRVTVAAVACKEVVTCFGIPGVSAVFVQELVRNILRDDLGHNIGIFFAEGISVVGLGSTILLGGMPVFLASGMINAAIVIPATMRLFLMVACDVVLILTRAYKDASAQCLLHPDKAGVEAAAFHYRDISKHVHKELKKLAPKSNVFKSFQTMRVKSGFSQVLEKYRKIFLEGVGMDMKLEDPDVGDADSDTTEVEPGNSLINDLEKAQIT